MSRPTEWSAIAFNRFTIRLAICFLAATACPIEGHAAAHCRTIAGMNDLLKPGRIILLGEIHGTREMPQVLVDLACNATARGLDAAVGFEVPPEMGVELQQYLSSKGERSERLRIIQPIRKFKDGRSSKAMTNTFEELRKLAATSSHISMFGFQGPKADVSYAEAIADVHRKSPRAVILTLMGNIHNRVSLSSDSDRPPTGMLLREQGLDVKSVFLDFSGGAAYNLGMNGPGIQTQPPSQTTEKTWTVLPADSPEYDFIISVGWIHPSLPDEDAR